MNYSEFKRNIFFRFNCLIFFVFIAFSLAAQNKAASSVQVDNLSDDQVKEVAKKVESSGLTQQQAEAAAMAKGMKPEEIQKLKDRVNNLNKNDQKTAVEQNKETTRQTEEKTDLTNKIEGSTINALNQRIFGYSLFNTKNLTFEPGLNLPTPQNYQIGPGDQIIIDIWGASQAYYKLTVNPEGTIIIDNVGPVFINGLSIESASKKVLARLSSIYAGLTGSNPNTFAQVSLGNMRSIKVTIIGEIRLPGTYTLPSLATVFNALYVSGGPGNNGSFRNILVYRDSKLITNLDAYDFLVKGDQKNNIRLQDQDIIMVKPYKVRVEIKGEVKNPAIYEIKDNEHISDVIDFAGGYTDKAYSYRLKVVRNTDKDYKIIDVENKQFASFSLENGDILTIDSILNVFENRVEIRGAVVRPGQYELTKGMTLKDLINIKAEGLKGDAFLSRAIIYRTNPDYSISSFPVDLAAIFKGQAEDILLQKEDILRVFSIYELQEGYNFTIDGEVNKPGTYPYIKEFSLGDLIASAGGFSESASLAKIEVSRRIKNSDPLSKSAQIADVFQFNVSKDLNLSDSASKFILQPFDQVIIRRSPGYEIQKLAYVYGEVQYPGSYIIKTKEEYLSDLITRAGGLRAEAFPKGAYLTRLVISDPVLRAKALNALRKSNDKESAEVPGNETEQIIGINLDKILEDPHSKYDLILQEGDVLKIPKELQTVKISGDLLYPVTVRFDNSIGLKSYISMAGGYGQEAKPSKTFVIYANGMVKRTKRFMGIKFYPKVEPGAEIFVPTKIKQEAKSTWSIQETAILVSMFTSLGTMAATLAYLFKK